MTPTKKCPIRIKPVSGTGQWSLADCGWVSAGVICVGNAVPPPHAPPAKCNDAVEEDCPKNTTTGPTEGPAMLLKGAFPKEFVSA